MNETPRTYVTGFDAVDEEAFIAGLSPEERKALESSGPPKPRLTVRMLQCREAGCHGPIATEFLVDNGVSSEDWAFVGHRCAAHAREAIAAWERRQS